MEEREDYETLSDLILSSDEDEGIVNNEVHDVEDTAKGV